ncbi:hypothetical protein G5V59_02260 [Nocardioides sp. W3-2-3]|uniref:hypothetical protein n=1 Tax=Nocardioides convexus TaxID=2712224 RepID=UPI00241828BE|nr:hypothetical protein [Nocardioides convexus]NGZ99597.1 hypothetical protein [Nocardioides convexus]
MDGYERYDEDVAAFWNRVGDAGSGRLRFALRHPAATVGGLREIRRLPHLHYEPGSGPGARALLATLRRRRLTRHDFALFGAAVLAVPDDPATLLQGRRQQTLRRMLRKAEQAGLSCRAVQPHERAALLKRANAMERQHRLDRYRVEEPDNDDLLEHPLWRVCEVHGRPVLLSVTPVDGTWSCLRYFRTLGASEHHTLARWLSTYDLVGQLVRPRRAPPARHRGAGRADERGAPLPADAGLPVRRRDPPAGARPAAWWSRHARTSVA